MWWCLALAFAANRWEGEDPDIRVEVDVALPAAEVSARLADLERASSLFAPSCLTRWSFGIPAAGVGGRARVTYTPSLMSRRLTVVVDEHDPGQRVVWDHEGPRGFWATFDLEERQGRTYILMETPLQPPPWPFRDLFFLKVKPAWESCIEDALHRLDG